LKDLLCKRADALVIVGSGAVAVPARMSGTATVCPLTL